jgi:hypothetical protein
MTVVETSRDAMRMVGRHTMRVIDTSGDSHISWDPANASEVAAAQGHFNRLRDDGYLAYRVEGAERGEVIREFDPGTAEIIMSPQLQGG